MSPIPNELTDLMIDSVTLEPSLGPNRYNTLQYGPAVAVQCQVIRSSKRALSREGREVTSWVQVVLADPTLAVSLDDRLTLADGQAVPLIEIMAIKDEDGPYYVELRG